MIHNVEMGIMRSKKARPTANIAKIEKMNWNGKCIVLWLCRLFPELCIQSNQKVNCHWNSILVIFIEEFT